MKGFSLVELMVVIAIIGLAGSVSVSIYNTLSQIGNVRHAAYVWVDGLKEAKKRAQMAEYDSDWGVKFNDNNVIIFNGSSYSNRDLEKDKIFNISKDLITSGVTEIAFTKVTGLPVDYGTTTFSNTFGSSSVYVSSGGVFNY